MYNSWRNPLKQRREGQTDDKESWERELLPSGSIVGSAYGAGLDDGSSTPRTLPPAFSSLPTRSARPRVGDRRNDPLGLHVLHDPGDAEPSVDIIFIHGLGGSSRLTWSWNRDLSHFWPKEWLPFEPELKQARILTFGYNAHFMSQSKDTFSVSDFAKDLLLQMKFGNDADGKTLNIGKVPLIFVVHSMGGLVVKKAYILGCQDPQYRHILDQVSSIVFLATPHRGSSLADTLKKLLFLSFRSPKQYVHDLMRNSPRISDINDQFRLHADKMQIVSFFETQATTIGPKRVVIVERDSATLGYPSEISAPLNADHHTVCKYASRQDANYVSVRNILKSLVEKATSIRGTSSELEDIKRLNEAMTRLMIPGRPDEILDNMLERYVPGSCDWMLVNETFTSFLDDQSAGSSVLQLVGPPGAGKSMMASFLVQHLAEELQRPVQFWYFRYDDHAKKSIRNCLLSLALQMANDVPEFHQHFVSVVHDIEATGKCGNRSLWQKLFLNILDKLDSKVGTVYWILDAIDESESPQTLFSYLALLRQAKFPLRIVFLSRPQTVTRYFEQLKASLPVGKTTQVELAAPEASLELYLTYELVDSPWHDVTRTKIMQSLLAKSQGNFLWLTLAVKRLMDCDTMEELDQALEETPEKVVEVYSVMETALVDRLESRDLRNKDPDKDVRLLKTILAWVTCSERHLVLEELAEALKPSFGEIFNLRHTISRLCGDFVVVDKEGRISLVHHTAKEYLTEQAGSFLAVQPAKCHTMIFSRCLDVLMGFNFRMRFMKDGCVGLLQYCCLAWSHHMDSSDVTGHGDDHVSRLAAFFRDRACLTWIEALANIGQVQVLDSTGRHLTQYLQKRHELGFVTEPETLLLSDEEFLGIWAIELSRITAHFGTHLAQYPKCIHTLIPLFSPAQSAISRQFSIITTKSSPSITGIANPGWNDHLAKFTVGGGQRPKAVLSLDTSFAIITSAKAVCLYHSVTFQEFQRFYHGEIILIAQFAREGDKLVTCGTKTIMVWDVGSARVLDTFSNPKGVRAMAVSFSRDSTEVIICSVDSKIWRQQLAMPEDWVSVSLQFPNVEDRSRYHGTPACASFSPDGSQIAVACRQSPITSWSTENGNLIGQCERARRHNQLQPGVTGYPSRLTWNPVTEHVVGIYNDGAIFKWYPLDSGPEEMEEYITAAEVACSPDGRLIVAGQKDGSIKIFRFDDFNLIYHLCGASAVTALTISTDGRRIYDLRHSYCNVWEPHVLASLAEEDDAANHALGLQAVTRSDTASFISEAIDVTREPVSAVCAGSSTKAYAFGNDAGAITYVQPDGRTCLDFACGRMATSCMTISDDGEYIAMASIDKVLVVYKLSGAPASSTERPTVTASTSNDYTIPSAPRSSSPLVNAVATNEPQGGHLRLSTLVQQSHSTDSSQLLVLQTKTEEPLIQVFFESTSSYLLGRSATYTTIRRLSSPDPVATRPNDGETDFWIAHPFDPSCFLSIGHSTITCHAAATLSPVSRWSIDLENLNSAGTNDNTYPSRRTSPACVMQEYFMRTRYIDTCVERVLVAPDKSVMLVESSTACTTRGRRDIHFFLLSTNFLATRAAPNQPTPSRTQSPPLGPDVVAQPLPKAISAQIEFVLGFIERDACISPSSLTPWASDSRKACFLAFIDREFWVRTWSLDDVEGTNSRRHFFLPRDWVNMDCLELAQVTADGRLLCPRNGEVAVVHNGLRMEWTE